MKTTEKIIAVVLIVAITYVSGVISATHTNSKFTKTIQDNFDKFSSFVYELSGRNQEVEPDRTDRVKIIIEEEDDDDDIEICDCITKDEMKKIWKKFPKGVSQNQMKNAISDSLNKAKVCVGVNRLMNKENATRGLLSDEWDDDDFEDDE